MEKYPSLINHYNVKMIKRFNRLEIFSCQSWIIQEKLHGANISIKIENDGSIKWFSRNQEVTNSNFYNADSVFKEFELTYVDNIKKFVGSDAEIILFGELYGDNIQKGVKYGNTKKLAFFDVYINNKLQTQSYFYNLVWNVYIPVVPFIAKLPSFEEAFNYNCEFNSKILNEDNNICEGIVIKPFETIILDHNGSPFYIKKKNDEFKEKQKSRKEQTPIDPELEVWVDLFDSYIHEERLESVFSKEGRIGSMEDLGKYIKLVINDAKETFYKEEDFDESQFEKKDLKKIFNQADKIKNLLFKELGHVV